MVPWSRRLLFLPGALALVLKRDAPFIPTLSVGNKLKFDHTNHNNLCSDENVKSQKDGS